MQLKILEFKGGQVKRYFEKAIEKVSKLLLKRTFNLTQ